MRFGFEYVEAALSAQGRRIVVVDPTERKDDLVQDMIEVLTSFCARLYGRRGHIANVGWGEFRRQLAYKTVWYGSKLTTVERFYPSSKTCSKCGYVVAKMPLSIREWDCPACGAHHDRD
ncbi:MAG: putative transposase, partial [Clostridia bacterium]|nr:putative transposase [Clostridia bacterium]